jgi:hypothetical protein
MKKASEGERRSQDGVEGGPTRETRRSRRTRALNKIGCAAVSLALALFVYTCPGHVDRRVSICRYWLSASIFCLVKINKRIDVLCDLFLHVSYFLKIEGYINI